MSSNVHTPENVRALRAEVDRPDRAVVEAAFRTIIRWTDDDPERDGLIDTVVTKLNGNPENIVPGLTMPWHAAPRRHTPQF
jgi:GTP cyclohydrolase I